MTDKQMIIDSGQRWLDAFDSKVLYVSRETVKSVLKVLEEEPQIVRCKDCKHWYKCETSHLCALTGDLRKPEWYCADGERKEGR